MRTIRIAAITLSIASGSCGLRTDTPASKIDHPSNAASGPVALDGPVSEPCLLGDISEDASQVALGELLKEPERYFGQPIRIRGYFILELENTSLLDPDHRQDGILINIRKLPA